MPPFVTDGWACFQTQAFLQPARWQFPGQTKLWSPQANIKEVEVAIPARLHNSLIGSKGCLVRSIMDDCGGVHIHFPSEGSGSDRVTIRGPASEVEKAKKQLLQLAEEKVGGETLGEA